MQDTRQDGLSILFLPAHYAAIPWPRNAASGRLVSDRLVQRREQCGQYGASISVDDLRELFETRCWMEGIAQRKSIRSQGAGRVPPRATPRLRHARQGSHQGRVTLQTSSSSVPHARITFDTGQKR